MKRLIELGVMLLILLFASGCKDKNPEPSAPEIPNSGEPLKDIDIRTSLSKTADVIQTEQFLPTVFFVKGDSTLTWKSYKWVFGDDGSTSTEATPTHYFSPEPGSITSVTVTVVDQNNQSHIKTKQVEIVWNIDGLACFVPLDGISLGSGRFRYYALVLKKAADWYRDGTVYPSWGLFVPVLDGKANSIPSADTNYFYQNNKLVLGGPKEMAPYVRISFDSAPLDSIVLRFGKFNAAGKFYWGRSWGDFSNSSHDGFVVKAKNNGGLVSVSANPTLPGLAGDTGPNAIFRHTIANCCIYLFFKYETTPLKPNLVVADSSMKFDWDKKTQSLNALTDYPGWYTLQLSFSKMPIANYLAVQYGDDKVIANMSKSKTYYYSNYNCLRLGLGGLDKRIN